MPAEQLPLLPFSQPTERHDRRPGLTARSTLHRAAQAFHKHMLHQELSEHTIKAFDSDLRLLAGFVGSRTPIETISTHRLERFLTYLQHERGVPCNPKSLARRLTTVKVFFSWLAEQGLLPADPAAPIVHKPVSTPLPRVLSEAECTQLLAATHEWRRDADRSDARPHLLVTLLLNTGIKKGECMNIALSDLDTADPQASSVFIHYPSTRQRYKERKLQLPPEFAATLSEYLAQYGPVASLFECTARNLEYVLDECSRRAGLPPRVLSFETLRWTCAVRDYQQGMDPDTLRRKLGLSRITWTDTEEKLRKLTAPAL